MDMGGSAVWGNIPQEHRRRIRMGVPQRNASGWIDGHVYVNAMLCDAMPCHAMWVS